jgi:hypothetical protein
MDMKTDIFDNRWCSVTSRLIASLTPVLVSLPLCFAAACVPQEQDGETAIKAQSLGAGCTLLRPVAWGGAPECHEGPTGPYSMVDTEVYFATAVPGGGWGSGDAEIRCDDGYITLVWWSCIPGGG